jgi:hypothetical protein
MTGTQLDLKALGVRWITGQAFGEQHAHNQPRGAFRLAVPERPGNLSLACRGCAASPAAGGRASTEVDQDTQYQWV